MECLIGMLAVLVLVCVGIIALADVESLSSFDNTGDWYDDM